MATGYIALVRVALLIGAYVSVLVAADTSGDCKEIPFMCFEKLRDAVKANNPSAVNDFLCSSDQKTGLNCVIEKFQECPNLKNATFIDELKHEAGNFHAVDLFTVTSSDQFCKCVPSWSCLNMVKEDQLFKAGQAESAEFSKLANKEYICGSGKDQIECVAKALPECRDYLQHKRNETASDFFDVSHLEFAEAFKKKRCEKAAESEMNMECSKKRSQWHATEVCVENAKLYVTEENQRCGMRRCLEKAMSTCPAGEMDYFIDSANVYIDVKISDKPCASSSMPLLAAVSTFFILCVHLAL